MKNKHIYFVLTYHIIILLLRIILLHKLSEIKTLQGLLKRYLHYLYMGIDGGSLLKYEDKNKILIDLQNIFGEIMKNFKNKLDNVKKTNVIKQFKPESHCTPNGCCVLLKYDFATFEKDNMLEGSKQNKI